MKKQILRIAVCLMLVIFSAVLASCNRQATEDKAEASQEVSAQHTHEWSKWTTVEKATCLSEGVSARTCSCGETESKTIAITSHKSNSWIIDKAATATESGKKHKECSVCHKIFQWRVIPATAVPLYPGLTDTVQDSLRPSYALGHCRKLEGNPVVVMFFMDDNESEWTAEEVEVFTEEHILVGLEYLEENAKKWGVELSFVTESYSTPSCGYAIKYEGKVNPNLYNGGSTKDVLDKAASDIGYQSNWLLYSYYQAKYPNDDIIFLTFLDKPGKSYARHSISTGYVEYAEHCVIFTDYYGSPAGTYDNGSRASTVAHELLHLFGAEDFYTPAAREGIAALLYPDDIMLWQYDDIENNSLGDCAAFSVGWTDDPPSVCYTSAWWKS